MKMKERNINEIMKMKKIWNNINENNNVAAINVNNIENQYRIMSINKWRKCVMKITISMKYQRKKECNISNNNIMYHQ